MPDDYLPVSDTLPAAPKPVGRPFTSTNNPGRPKGAKNKSTVRKEQFKDKDVRAVATVVMAAAREGADWACKLVLPPQPKARGPLVTFPMPPLHTRQDCVDAMGGLLSATAAGLLSLDEAADCGIRSIADSDSERSRTAVR